MAHQMSEHLTRSRVKHIAITECRLNYKPLISINISWLLTKLDVLQDCVVQCSAYVWNCNQRSVPAVDTYRSSVLATSCGYSFSKVPASVHCPDFSFVAYRRPRCTVRTFHSSHIAGLGALYGLFSRRISPASVHCTDSSVVAYSRLRCTVRMLILRTAASCPVVWVYIPAWLKG